MVIDTLRQLLINKGMQDENIDGTLKKELSKGPPQVRNPSREELKMEIKSLNSQIILLKQ